MLNSSLAKINLVREKFSQSGIDAFFTGKPENVRYLTRFSGSSAALVITESDSVFITDSRYTEQASEETSGCEIREAKKIVEDVARLLNDKGVKKIGFESTHTSYDDYIALKKDMKGPDLIPTRNIIEDMRMIKSEEEIELIKKSAEIAGRAFTEIQGLVKPGITEKDIAIELEYNLLRNGADAIAFDLIVASGERGALPHGIAGKRKLEEGDLVILDFGAKYNGYYSDCSRTLSVGEPDEIKKYIYQVVWTAQQKAIAGVRSGISAHAIDSLARQHIKDAGFGDRFGHGTGHGVGLEIHEGPTIKPGQDQILQNGMVFTVEPGIYVPGSCGVRIEDMVLVQEKRASVITSSIKKKATL